jgi:membrane protein implicated in regulation of membrane protease activity
MIIDAPSFWTFLPQTWVIVGVLLIILEIFDGNLISLSFGVSALILALLLLVGEKSFFGDFIIIESTRELLYAYGVISLLSIVLIKFFFQSWKNKRGEKDINIY